MAKEWYKTTIKVEVLSDYLVDPQDLEGVHYLITDGGCSGQWSVEEQVKVGCEEMARLLEAQGSDPEFLGCGPIQDEHLEAIQYEIGYAPDSEIIQEAINRYADRNTEELQEDLAAAVAMFTATGGDDAELAYPIDSMRIALAVRRVDETLEETP